MGTRLPNDNGGNGIGGAGGVVGPPGAGGQPGGNQPPEPQPGGRGWSFDPGEVYGWTRLVFRRAAIAYWRQPNHLKVGFDRFAETGPWLTHDGRLLYIQGSAGQGNTLREFVCDVCAWPADRELELYPDAPLANDPIVSTPCDRLQRIMLGPTGEIYKTCSLGFVAVTYNDADEEISRPPGAEGQSLCLGYDDKMLTTSHLIDFRNDTVIEIDAEWDVASGEFCRVAGTNAFFMARPFILDAEDVERWTIDATTGVGTLDGAYPPLPPGLRVAEGSVLPVPPVLDGEGNLFNHCENLDGERFIVRRTLDGTSEIVFDVKQSDSQSGYAFITGP